MGKTHTIFLFKIISFGIYTGFCAFVQFLKTYKSYFFLPSIIYQIRLIQGDSVARGPKLLPIKNYVIEIMA